MSLITGNAKTIYGKNIIESLPKPTITTNDLLMDTSFNLGIALSAVKVLKSGNIELANELMYKSMLYTTRNLIYFTTKKLIVGYNNIYNESKKFNCLNDYVELLETAIQLRNQTLKDIDHSVYYKNISFINKFAIPFLMTNS